MKEKIEEKQWFDTFQLNQYFQVNAYHLIESVYIEWDKQQKM